VYRRRRFAAEALVGVEPLLSVRSSFAIRWTSGTTLIAGRRSYTILDMATRHFDFSALTTDERIRLATELWDSVSPDSVRLSERQATELERRREHLRQHGSQGRPWREALREIKKRGT
jgi:putative addiction module component (TIGR02574 family)